MSGSFEYKPRFTDIRVKPPKPEEEAAAKDVLRLKPGEIPCEWADCSRPATAKAPKSREQINLFYNFCQGHAAQYNKAWNFYAGMSEGEVRAAQENEAMTGGRPTWDMKVSRNTREAAGNAANAGNAGPGSWQDSYGLFGRRVNESAPSGPVMSEAEARMGKLERQAIGELGLEPGASKADVKARYHELLKRFHPDMNAGDRATETKLQNVIKAYKSLKKAGYA
ncbi:J domain-containing protein [Brevundimonas sp.]|uniref:J domain-containing protein n=4 Tax=Brevundimonas sp. TaxID=1871086 RepID=UPI002FC929B9